MNVGDWILDPSFVLDPVSLRRESSTCSLRLSGSDDRRNDLHFPTVFRLLVPCSFGVCSTPNFSSLPRLGAKSLNLHVDLVGR